MIDRKWLAQRLAGSSRRPLAAALLGLALLALIAQQRAHAFGFDLNLTPEEFDGENGVEQQQQREEQPLHIKSTEQAPDEWADQRRKRRKTGHTEAAEQPRGLISGLWAKVRNGLPDYFDFAKFRDKFKRKYSAVESLLRQSIFLQKCYAVFKSRVDFRLGRKSYLEGVNQFSDRTPQEFRTMFMAAPPVELLPSGANELEHRKKFERRLEQLDELNSENYVPELQSQAAASDDNGTGAQATLGGLLNEKQVKQLIEQWQASEGATSGDRQFEEALLHELEGFEVEMESQSAGGDDDDDDEDEARRLPWPGMAVWPGKQPEVENDTRPYEPPRLAANERLDWSRHECFHEVYSQGTNCGKCYVMASTALAEFYKCAERGPSKAVKRKFSKDYVLDCAQKYTPAVMGCAGGSPLHTLRFIATAGIFNIRDWRQRRVTELKEARQHSLELDALDMKCPLSPYQPPLNEWGPIRVELNPRQVGTNYWLEALQDGPLVASVQMPAEGVDSYAGGVHDGAGCATSGAWHAMLLVGYGRNERGQAYWRFRNSFGPDWGDKGHFNLAMEVPGACLPGAVRVFRGPLAEE